MSFQFVATGNPDTVTLVDGDGETIAELSAPYTFVWDTTNLAEGEYFVRGKAVLDGEEVFSSIRKVLVDRTPPMLVDSYPKTNDTNVGLAEVWFAEFDENVVKADSLFLSDLSVDLPVSAVGTRLELEPIMAAPNDGQLRIVVEDEAGNKNVIELQIGLPEWRYFPDQESPFVDDTLDGFRDFLKNTLTFHLVNGEPYMTGVIMGDNGGPNYPVEASNNSIVPFPTNDFPIGYVISGDNPIWTVWTPDSEALRLLTYVASSWQDTIDPPMSDISDVFRVTSIPSFVSISDDEHWFAGVNTNDKIVVERFFNGAWQSIAAPVGDFSHVKIAGDASGVAIVAAGLDDVLQSFSRDGSNWIDARIDDFRPTRSETIRSAKIRNGNLYIAFQSSDGANHENQIAVLKPNEFFADRATLGSSVGTAPDSDVEVHGDRVFACYASRTDADYNLTIVSLNLDVGNEELVTEDMRLVQGNIANCQLRSDGTNLFIAYADDEGSRVARWNK